MKLERVINDVQRQGGRGGVVEGESVECRFADPWGWGKGQRSLGYRDGRWHGGRVKVW